MTNLPISTNIPAAQATGKPASPDDASPQGADGFGQMLARQVADSSAPADKKTDAEAASSAALPDKEAALAAATALPADMLAALLVQQNSASSAQALGDLQPGVNKPAPGGMPAAPLTAVADKDSTALHSTPALLQAGTAPTAVQTKLAAKSAISQASLQEGTRQTARSMAQDQAGFTDTLKSMGRNAATPALSGELPRNLNLAEMAVSAQQPGEAALVTSQAAITPAIRDAANAAPLALSTPLAQAGWDHEFSQKITWLATQRDQSAELHLNPPQLGPLDVVIKVSADQATALFTSPHAAVREAIEQALPKLREMLADNGIMLGNATVSDQASRRDQNGFARAQQGSGTDSGRAEEVTAAMSQGERVSSLPRHNGMVDTFA